MLVHCFSPDGWEGWSLRGRPAIRDQMPVLIDDDLRFEDGCGPRPATVMNEWLRELPITGAAESPDVAGLRSGAEELGGIPCGAAGPVFADHRELRESLSAYAEYRLAGPLEARLAPASWNLAVKTLSAFYSWAAAEGRAGAVPFSYIPQVITRPDGSRVEITRNLATVRTGKAHATRKYLERPYTELLMNALAGNAPAGRRDPMFAGRQTGRQQRAATCGATSRSRSAGVSERHRRRVPLDRMTARIRERYDAGFGHVHPHMLRHSFAMHTLERLVRGYYQQAAKLVVDTGGDDALALYLTKADPLLVLRDLLGHASVTTTQAYLHLLDTQRIYRDAYASAAPNPGRG